jgi:hypothetical protein
LQQKVIFSVIYSIGGAALFEPSNNPPKGSQDIFPRQLLRASTVFYMEWGHGLPTGAYHCTAAEHGLWDACWWPCSNICSCNVMPVGQAYHTCWKVRLVFSSRQPWSSPSRDHRSHSSCTDTERPGLLAVIILASLFSTK